MDPIITTYLSELELGQPQQFKNLSVVPLFTSLSEGAKYITLGRALGRAILSVTEVHESASVPELKVANKGKVRVLLLDGEARRCKAKQGAEHDHLAKEKVRDRHSRELHRAG